MLCSALVSVAAGAEHPVPIKAHPKKIAADITVCFMETQPEGECRDPWRDCSRSKNTRSSIISCLNGVRINSLRWSKALEVPTRLTIFLTRQGLLL